MARFELENIELATIGGRAMSADVFFELGLMYAAGRDVATDYVAAHKWFNLAAMGGNEAAKEYRAEIASQMSKEDRARALRAARQWMSLH